MKSNIEARQRERIYTEVHPSAVVACRGLAAEIATLIRTRAAEGRNVVLGLATGSTPVPLYRELIRLHREEGLSFRNVITFNLDEYHGLTPEHPESYSRFMREQLFNHIDLPASQSNVPDGRVPRGEVFAWCRAYEQKIAAAGGIDLQVLGIGRTGHIGFNEPGSARDSRTRLVTLDSLTRRDAARDFLGEANVPRYAITMGVGTILEARKVVLLAWGEAKARMIAQATEGRPNETIPATLLQDHPDVRFLLDPAAAAELTRIKHPWLVTPVEWTPPLARRAIAWLSSTAKRPVLKLLDEHYGEHGMADLLTEQGPAYNLNIRAFNEIQHTITGWPGGKPNADDSHRPERASPHPKRVVVFSPEPSDEMLGMGGTLTRLIEQGHSVTVVYLTSGNLAVPDEEAMVAADLVLEFATSQAGGAATAARRVRDAIAAKQSTAKGQDTADTRRLKGLLRRGEARAALRNAAVPSGTERFLDLAFYENGRYRQFRATEADVAQVAAVLRELKPHQIFATGAGQDPASVSGMCFDVLRSAIQQVKTEGWWQDCRVWLYRTPDKAWAAHEIDMAVPLSPAQLTQKIQAVYQHKSQRSQMPVFEPGLHEAWQQAEAAARSLAKTYDALGLAEYEAIEAFQRWHDDAR
ncbi:glucosamine-6-phosphate deaminase [Opitutus sp. ER46]|uniref:glucosamine-6-phosphate deaminase n=1 Tax=Opitutus sp. ER46 TaxID=2161864 RepID=UPI0018EE9920|nr:glucosamine-6-phosphate deaminase [Opitutus sp. ER46]